MKIEDFNDTTPQFIPELYFNGAMRAYGVIKNRSGKIIRSFKGTMTGEWESNGIGTLKERFEYNNGEIQNRTWRLVPTQPLRYIATADDIVGESTMIANGNTVMLKYTMRVSYKGRTIDIDVQDWLHLQSDGVIINHSQMKKFGFRVGELVVTIIKDSFCKNPLEN